MPLPTVGEIARRAGVPSHRVSYHVYRHGIKPASRAGIARVFSEETAAEIVAELRRVADFRGETLQPATARA